MYPSLRRLAAFGLGVACAAAGAAQAQEEPIRVGALYNLTGGMSSIDAPAYRGAQLHVKQINENGGLLGRNVELIGIDTQTDQQEAATAAQKLISEEVVAGIGYGDTNFVQAAAPIFQTNEIPFVTSGATHPMLPTGIGDYMFMTGFGDDDQSYAIADYAYNELGLRDVAVWTDRSMAFTTTLSKFFLERWQELGGTIVIEDVFELGDTDFSAQISRLEAEENVDAVFAAAVPSSAGLIVKQIRESGLDLPILSADGFDTELVSTVPGEELANDVWFSAHAYRGSDRPEVEDFIEAYNQEYGREPENAFSPLGYDAIGLIANAIRNAESAEPQAIRDALEETRGYQAVTGEISYVREGGVPPKPVTIVEVQNGEFELVDRWYPEGFGPEE